MADDFSSSGAAAEEHATASLVSSSGDPKVGATAAARQGNVIAGKYLVEQVLGAGGMGVVVSAMHLVLHERVALKFLSSSAGSTAVRRFRREAQVAARIKSEHVARTMDVGTLEDGAPYLVMELLLGENLAARLRAKGELSIEEAVDYVLQACEAIAEAHALGVVHRDLKPSNLFLTHRADGSVLLKVLDFGIAKLLEGHTLGVGEREDARSLTTTSAVLGSPFYMSPEQVRSSRAVDVRADIWSLGVILHELLAGRPPFDAETPSAVLAAIAADAPAHVRDRRPDVPEALQTVILRCLEKNMDRRFADIGAFAAALSPFAHERSRVSIERSAKVLREAVAAPKGEAVEIAAAPATSQTLSAWDSVRGSAGKELRYFAAGAALVAIIGGVVVWTRALDAAPKSTTPVALIPSAAEPASSPIASAPEPSPTAQVIPAVSAPLPSAAPAVSARVIAPAIAKRKVAAEPTAQAKTNATAIATPVVAATATTPHDPDVDKATAERY